MIVFTKPPLVVQRLLFPVLAFIGRALGYRGSYPKYGAPEPASGEVVAHRPPQGWWEGRPRWRPRSCWHPHSCSGDAPPTELSAISSIHQSVPRPWPARPSWSKRATWRKRMRVAVPVAAVAALDLGRGRLVAGAAVAGQASPQPQSLPRLICPLIHGEVCSRLIPRRRGRRHHPQGCLGSPPARCGEPRSSALPHADRFIPDRPDNEHLGFDGIR